MKPLYILSNDDVRRERATMSEIRDFVRGERSWGRELARVEIDESGDITATPLTAEELQAIGRELDAAQAEQLRGVLDAAVVLSRTVRGIDGVSVGGFGMITVWADNAPWAEAVIVEWAEARRAEVVRSSPPRDAKTWYPDMIVKVDGRDIVRVVWPSVELGEKALAVEVMANGIAQAMEAF